MTRTSQQVFHRNIDLDPIVCRQRAGEVRSRELAILAGALLRALRQASARLRRTAMSSAEVDARS